MSICSGRLHDPQQAAALCECDRCRGDIYNEVEAEPDDGGAVYCKECREALDKQERQAEEWRKARKNGIGASDAACILGLNPWKNKIQLWEEKTGRREAPDIGGKDVVRYGKEAEAPLRALFALDFPEYIVRYDEFAMRSQPDKPWLFATLDGELEEKNTGRYGVLEIKTTEIRRSSDWKAWDGKVPGHYYPQVLHQFLATGCDFIILKAQIKYLKDGDIQIATRHYRFERRNNLESMDVLLKAETEFWACVTTNKRPAGTVLPQI